jgi:type I restriction enzyme, S subunit
LLISEDGENLRTRNTPIAFQAQGRFWVNNHAHILAEKEEGILDYLEYYFSILNINPYITGAVQPKLNKANLDAIEIPIPPVNERLLINQILNSLKEKILLNNQINQALESIAQAIFKSWFIDFDPVRAKIAAKLEGKNPELAAMCAISGKSEAELEQMAKEDFAELLLSGAISIP